MLDASGLRTVNMYVFNSQCHCAWCRNSGRNPLPPGHPDTLGYDEPHIPPPGDAPSQLTAGVIGSHAEKYGV